MEVGSPALVQALREHSARERESDDDETTMRLRLLLVVSVLLILGQQGCELRGSAHVQTFFQ